MSKLKNGIIFFFVHFLIEIVTFYVLSSYIKDPAITVLVSASYDFLAFVPQALYGYLLDKKIKIPVFELGIGFSLLSIIFKMANLSWILVIIFLSIGNGLIHVEGAQKTLRTGNGGVTNAGLFVAGGSFGLIIGKTLGNYNVNPTIAIAICLLLVIPAIFTRLDKIDYNDMTSLNKFNTANPDFPPIIVIILATFVVAVRAFIGYGIPTSWNVELWQAFVLYFAMGIGKALGGILVDKIGVRVTALISTIGAIPFLIFGDNIMIVSVIGVTLFSMTMSITLSLLVSVMKNKPGLAFGLTTIGLFIGTTPIFFYSFDGVLAIVLIVVLSLVCGVILFAISKKGRNIEL